MSCKRAENKNRFSTFPFITSRNFYLYAKFSLCHIVLVRVAGPGLCYPHKALHIHISTFPLHTPRPPGSAYKSTSCTNYICFISEKWAHTNANITYATQWKCARDPFFATQPIFSEKIERKFSGFSSPKIFFFFLFRLFFLHFIRISTYTFT